MSKVNFIEIKDNKELLKITNDAAKELKNRKIEIADEAVATIGIVTLNALIAYVKETGKELNFCQILNLQLEDGEVLASPGQEFKLLVKSDDKSEEK